MDKRHVYERLVHMIGREEVIQHCRECVAQIGQLLENDGTANSIGDRELGEMLTCLNDAFNKLVCVAPEEVKLVYEHNEISTASLDHEGLLSIV